MLRDPRTDAAASGVTGGRFALGVIPAILGVLLTGAPAAAQFSAQPVILEMRGRDSMTVAVFTVRNEAETPLQFDVYAGDFDQPPDGGHEFLEPGAHPRSCVQRLQFYPDNLLLDPGKSGDVRVVMQPGDSTCWSLIFVQNVARAESGLQVSQRIGIKVYGLGLGAVPAGEIREVAVEDHGADGLVAALSFENLGNEPLRPEGEIEIRTESGEVVAVVPVAPFSVLPGRHRRAVVPITVALPPGRYLAIPILDFGGEYLAGGQAVFQISG